MLKIRLQRIGRKNDPSFRLVVVDSHEGPKTGNHVAVLGFWNPISKERTIDAESVKAWMAKGAQISDTVHNMLVNAKILDAKKINVLPKKSPIKKEGSETPEVAPAPAAEATSEAVAEVAPEPAVEPTPEPTPEPAEAPVENA